MNQPPKEAMIPEALQFKNSSKHRKSVQQNQVPEPMSIEQPYQQPPIYNQPHQNYPVYPQNYPPNQTFN